MHATVNRWILVCGLVAACGGTSGESTGSASQGGSTGGASATEATATATTATTTTTATEGGGSGGATEGGSGTVAETGAAESGGNVTEAATTAADLCAGYKPPGCKKNSCAEGEECKVVEGMCVPTMCKCDPATGEESCEQDCGGASCAPTCPDIVCDLECEFGFKTDPNGCQLCECVEAPPPVDCMCATDADCVKTSSGCCPCSAGGDEVPAHVNCVDQVMMCDLPPDQVICPQVYQCTDVQPACVAGECVLL